MRYGSSVTCYEVNFVALMLLGLLALVTVPVTRAVPQTASTGALTGEVLDSTGRGIAGASVEAENPDTAVSRSTLCDDEGSFVLTLLPPGTYQLTVRKGGYSQEQSSVDIAVTESIRLSISLRIAGTAQTIVVRTSTSQVQTDSAALRRVVDGDMVTNLPLVTRNYTQIAVLSPGVSAGVFNAGEL